ncbi:hypothetical protein AAFF_G00396860 [Aldrovandia affinis]|uniref:Uncharacterized protein n=1 Tax=Aldrovandia affinis TaxID=143900 RepID=A0AAD7WKL3_9TELE|nr:hypothetical protein AAFF_G00396860 [Aldrovandia affinis]
MEQPSWLQWNGARVLCADSSLHRRARPLLTHQWAQIDPHARGGVHKPYRVLEEDTGRTEMKEHKAIVQLVQASH